MHTWFQIESDLVALVYKMLIVCGAHVMSIDEKMMVCAGPQYRKSDGGSHGHIRLFFRSETMKYASIFPISLHDDNPLAAGRQCKAVESFKIIGNTPNETSMPGFRGGVYQNGCFQQKVMANTQPGSHGIKMPLILRVVDYFITAI